MKDSKMMKGGNSMLERLFKIVAAASILFGCVVAASAAEGKVLFKADFESENPLQFWTTGGADYTIVTNELTEERSFEGKKSAKLVFTTKAGYTYFHVPIGKGLPAAGDLRVRARLWIEKLPDAMSAGIGVSCSVPSGGFNGSVSSPQNYQGVHKEWMDIDFSAEEEARKTAVGWTKTENVPTYVNTVILIFYGRSGDEEAEVYLDDVVVTGKPVENYEEVVRLAARKEIADFLKEMGSVDEAVRLLNRLSQRWQSEGTKLPAPIQSFGKDTLERARELSSQLKTDVKSLREGKVYLTEDVRESLKSHMGMITGLGDFISSLGELAEASPDAAFIPYILPAITDDLYPPDTLNVPGRIGLDVELNCCREEYEPVLIVLYPLRDVEDVTVEAAPFKGERAGAPVPEADVRILKYWFQNGRRNTGNMRKTLVQELLVKDDGLVRVDEKAGTQELHVIAPDGTASYVDISTADSLELEGKIVRDSKELLPFSLEKGKLKFLWVTVYAPSGTAGGEYEGALSITAKGGKPLRIRLSVSVPDFELAPPELEYSIYYRGKLVEGKEPGIDSESKTEEQFRAELLNMKAHGVVNPSIYQSCKDPLFARVLDIRNELEMSKTNCYFLGLGAGAGASAKEDLERILKLVKEKGYGDLYLYGMDEAGGKRLASQRGAWQATRNAGAKIFVACFGDFFDLVGDLLDVAIMAGELRPDMAQKVHGAGNRIFNYANPQCGAEMPLTYRRNYGLALWKAGYDGAMDYAYQHSFGHGWNDFDDRALRDHVMAYPTADGVIDTIQWEGFREGIDDVRYVTTLKSAIAEAKQKGAKMDMIEKAEKFLRELNPDENLDRIRKEMIVLIEQLKAVK